MIYSKKRLEHSVNVFMNEFRNNNIKTLKESIQDLVEILENKTDPDPEDIIFCDTLYRLTEDFDKINYILGKIKDKNSKSLFGNKLFDLYYN